MFKRILVATDGSDHARKALELAADLAVRDRAEMFILHVLPPGPMPGPLRRTAKIEGLAGRERRRRPTSYSALGIQALAEIEDDDEPQVLQALGERWIGDGVALARSRGVETVRSAIQSGDPASRVLERAKVEKADLIVVGSRGRSDLKGLRLGSVSHKVCQLASCTCVTVK